MDHRVAQTICPESLSAYSCRKNVLQDGPSVNRMSTKTDLSQLSKTELAYPLVSLNELPAKE